MNKAAIWTGLVTYIAVPIWFIILCLIMANSEKGINGPGVILYMGILFIIGIPFAFFVLSFSAPLFNKISEFWSVCFMTILSFHGIIFLSLYLIYKVLNTGVPTWINAVMIPFYFLLFLAPPSLVGCVTYSLLIKKMKSNAT